MPSPRPLLITLSSVVLFVVFALPLTASAQVLAPHKPVPPVLPQPKAWHSPATSRSIVGGLWMTDANFKSTIYIRNQVETSPVTVKPVLYLSNGVAYPLPPVILEPSGVAVVSINDALAQQGLAPYATLSGYVEVDYSWPWDPLCVTVSNVDTQHSLIFTYGLAASMPATPKIHGVHSDQPAPQTVEGVWWRQEPSVTGFVALSNTTAQQLDTSVSVSGSGVNALGGHDVTISPHGTKLVELPEIQSAVDPTGGLEITYQGAPGALVISGGLEDQASGYSANLPFHSAPASSAKSSVRDYSELGLMTGAADPMMSFPSGTFFTPYSVVRNISDAPISITPTLWWMSGGDPHSTQLGKLTLAPLQSMNLNLPTLLAEAGLMNYTGSFNLAFQAQGKAGALLMAGGSVDRSNTYVFEVAPRAVKESTAKALSDWSTANGDDTMVTLWNPADEAQDFVFSLYYSGGHYDLPIHLEPRATRVFNISEVIQNQIPDAEGNTIPLSIHQGTASISGPEGESQDILVAMDSGIYNVRKATCALHCEYCTGATEFFLTANPFAVAVGNNTQLTATAQYNTGHQFDLTSASTWSSDHTSVATVSGGLVNGVSVGAADISSWDESVPLYGQVCVAGEPECPYDEGGGGEAPGNVTPSVSFSGTPIIPLGGTAPITATVTPTTNTSTITLTITPTNNAIFTSTGSSTTNITTTTTLSIAGVVAGNVQLTATFGTGESTTLATITLDVTPTNGAIPADFRQTGVAQEPNAVLQFTYTWGSSSGEISDLGGCQVREYVTYPGPLNQQYFWQSPPYEAGSWSLNPDFGATPGPATAGSLIDTQGHVNFGPSPYKYSNVTSQQVYQFECPYFENGQWVTMAPASGTIPITRVIQDVNGTWQYSITKSGASNAGALP